MITLSQMLNWHYKSTVKGLFQIREVEIEKRTLRTWFFSLSREELG